MDQNDDRCGLDPIVTPRWDLYRKRACKPHDEAYQAKKDGRKHPSLAAVSGRWIVDTTVTAATAAVAVATFPLYLVGGLVGGAIRWFQIKK
jgi:hypothetical protein